MSAAKTNAQRILSQKRISFRSHCYDTADGQLDAVAVAGKINVSPERVFKTLVARSCSGAVCVFLVGAAGELDLKAAARAVGEKSVEMVKVSDITPLTGYVKGGCSPIGMKKHYPSVVDSSALEFESIVISAGRIGLQIELAPADLRAAIGCEFLPISRR